MSPFTAGDVGGRDLSPGQSAQLGVQAVGFHNRGQPDGDLRLQPAFLGEPTLPEPITGIGFEVERGDVEEHQARGAQARMRRAGSGQRLPPGRAA